jgi:hypothetical protein
LRHRPGLGLKAACEGTARNPEAAGKIQTMLILGLAFVESWPFTPGRLPAAAVRQPLRQLIRTCRQREAVLHGLPFFCLHRY